MAVSGRIDTSLRTDQGRVRGRNEDFVARWEPAGVEEAVQHGHLYIVADGVGGAEAGDVASRFATERTIHHYLERHDIPNWGERLQTAMQAANDDLRQMVADRGAGTRMATTLVAALIAGRQLYLANVGDSRGYLWRRGEIEQLTKDQSLVAQLVEEGAITSEEAETHPHRNVILYSLGSERSPKIDLFTLTLEAGDRLLLCSDGLTRYVSDDEMGQWLAMPDLATLTRKLVTTANDRGGGDNITVAVLHIAALPEITAVNTVPMRPVLVASAQSKSETMPVLSSAQDSTPTTFARRALWVYTAFLCILQTIVILIIWLQLQV